MRIRLKLAFLLSGALCVLSPQNSTSAYDDYVYNNLLKSRDALLAQQSELQRAYDDTRTQMDNLNKRLARIDTYLRQVQSALRDVDDALKGQGR